MRWLDKIKEALNTLEVIRRGNEHILNECERINARIDALNLRLDKIQQKLDERAIGAHDAGIQENREQAIRATRPSWPRMRRQLEEDDVRKMIDQKANYWAAKQARVDEELGKEHLS